MILIAISIVVLVLCGKYKQTPTKNMRTGLIVTTIISTVLSFFELVSVISLGVFKGFMGSEEFYDMMHSAIMSGDLDIEDFATASEAIDFAVSMTSAFIIIAMVICALIMAFGIVASVFGFRTIADKSIAPADMNNVGAVNNNMNYANNYQYNSNYNPAGIQNSYAAPVNNDWYCICGNKNAAGQKFCSNCGAANPNNNQ